MKLFKRFLRWLRATEPAPQAKPLIDIEALEREVLRQREERAQPQRANTTPYNPGWPDDAHPLREYPSPRVTTNRSVRPADAGRGVSDAERRRRDAYEHAAAARRRDYDQASYARFDTDLTIAVGMAAVDSSSSEPERCAPSTSADSSPSHHGSHDSGGYSSHGSHDSGGYSSHSSHDSGGYSSGDSGGGYSGGSDC